MNYSERVNGHNNRDTENVRELPDCLDKAHQFEVAYEKPDT